MHFGPEIILVVMTGKFKTMTLVEEAELDRLRQRQIKDYNAALNSLTKIQGKCKILAHLQERFGFLFNKVKNAVLPPPNVLPPQVALPLTAADDHVSDGPSGAAVEADTEGIFLPLKWSTKRKPMLPLKLSHLQRPLRI